MPKIALIQLKSSENPAENLAKTLQQMRLAVSNGANIICTQELFTTQYFCTEEKESHFSYAEEIPGATTQAMQAFAQENNVVIVGSIFERRAAGIHHNTAFVIDADGAYLGKYRKMHIPQDPGFEEKYYFTPSDDGFKIFKTKFGKLGVLICWDQWFPEAARITSLMGAELLIYPTAIGWLSEEKGEIGDGQRQAWQTIQRSHAIANGVFVASINRVGTEGNTEFWGSSFVADPFGKMLTEGPKHEENIIYADIDFQQVNQQRITWPFLRDRRVEHYSGISKLLLDPHE